MTVPGWPLGVHASRLGLADRRPALSLYGKMAMLAPIAECRNHYRLAHSRREQLTRRVRNGRRGEDVSLPSASAGCMRESAGGLAARVHPGVSRPQQGTPLRWLVKGTPATRNPTSAVPADLSAAGQSSVAGRVGAARQVIEPFRMRAGRIDLRGQRDMDPKAPDIVLLGAKWPDRALVRAQLIEEGFDVVALDTWPIPRLYRRPGMKPRLLIIDLHELPSPRNTLDEVRFVLPPDRVLVLTALGSITSEDVQRFGFHVLERPTTIGEIAGRASALLAPDASGRESRTARRVHVKERDVPQSQ